MLTDLHNHTTFSYDGVNSCEEIIENAMDFYEFLTNPDKQRIIKESNISISIGSDTHNINDFNVNKILSCHNLVHNLGNPIIFS